MRSAGGTIAAPRAARTAAVPEMGPARRIAGALLLVLSLTFLSLLTIAAGGYALARFAGFETVILAGGSMAPQALAGDLVLARPHGSEVRIGGVYVFRTDAGLITHRVIAAGSLPGTLITRGDANPVADPFLLRTTDVIGDPVLIVRRAGFLLLAVASLEGRVGAVLLVVTLVALLALGVRWGGLGSPPEPPLPTGQG